MSALAAELTEALAELDQWVKGDRTMWNECHGSVTGDYEGQVLLTLQSDNARIAAHTAKVNALTELMKKE